MSISKILIAGAGGFGREVKWLIDEINKSQEKWETAGFLDDTPGKEGEYIHGIKVLGGIDWLQGRQEIYNIVIALGSPDSRKKVYGKIIKIYDRAIFPNLIHPSALIGPTVKAGIGCIICAGNILTTDISLGNFNTINLSCTIGHDVKTGDFCTFSPGSNISGWCNVGQCCNLGSNCCLIPKCSIGSFTTIGAGAVVTGNLPENCTAVGIPAKVIKIHKLEDK